MMGKDIQRWQVSTAGFESGYRHGATVTQARFLWCFETRQFDWRQTMIRALHLS
jgi:hypothetical protein